MSIKGLLICVGMSVMQKDSVMVLIDVMMAQFFDADLLSIFFAFCRKCTWAMGGGGMFTDSNNLNGPQRTQRTLNASLYLQIFLSQLCHEANASLTTLIRVEKSLIVS